MPAPLRTALATPQADQAAEDLAAPPTLAATRPGLDTQAGARWAIALAVLVFTTVAALPVLLVEHFPSQNGPFTALDVVVARAASSGASHWQGFYTSHLAGHFSGTLAIRFLLFASRTLPLYTAEKLLVFLCVVALGPATLYLIRRLNPTAEVWALVVPCIALSWPLCMGFYSFALGLPLFVATLGYVLPELDEGHAPPALLLRFSFLLVLLAFAHPELPPLAASAAGLYALVRAPTGRRIKTALGVLLASIPAAILTGPVLVGALLDPLHPDGAHAEHPLTSLALLPSHLAYSQRPIAWLLAVVPFAALFASVVRRFTNEAIVLRPDGVTVRLQRSHALPALGAALLLAILLVPNAGPAFIGATARLPLVLLFIGLAFVPAPEGRWRLLTGGGLVALALAITTINVREVRRQANALDEYDAVAQATPEGATLLPLSFARPRPSGSDLAPPLAHAWAYPAIARGLRIPLSTGATATALTEYVDVPERARLYAPGDRLAERTAWELLACTSSESLVSCAAARKDGFAALLRYGRAYDRILTWEAPADFLALATASGYHIEQRSARATLLSPRQAMPTPAP